MAAAQIVRRPPIRSTNHSLTLVAEKSLIELIRDDIRARGPISFAAYMEQALYHPEHGYYSADKCAIGRRGDYFTSVSVGPLFGIMVAGQFAEIWRLMGRTDHFVIVEQGAHHGEFATDVLESLRARAPEFFAKVRYRIVEPFAGLRKRQEGVLRQFGGKVEWSGSLEEMPHFTGVYFCNELLDALPVRLLAASGEPGKREWRERMVERTSCGFTFVERPIADQRLRARVAELPPAPPDRYETEVSLEALAWVDAIAAKIERGVVLVADYGFARLNFYSPERTAGSLQAYANHRVIPSPLEDAGDCDLSAHVEWTSVAERAEERGLRLIGFTDQHHFLTSLLSSQPELASAGAEKSRALQTLIHPEFMGTKFQFLALGRELPANVSLGGFLFAANSRAALSLG